MIRLKVFIPVLLIVALSVWFAIYRLDIWLKYKLENVISDVTGTKIDISDLRLSFRNSSLKIKKLQIASSTEKYRNLIEFGNIVVDFESLPLLRKRFVIDEFSVKGIAWDTPRDSSVFLPHRSKSNKPSWYSKWADEAFNKTKVEFNKLPIEKLADFRVPTSTEQVLNSLQLESQKAYKDALGKVQKSKTRWLESIKNFKSPSEYQEKIRQAQQLMRNLPQNPQDILQRVEDAKKIVQFFEDEKDKAADVFKQAKGDFDNLQSLYGEANQALQDDYKKALSMVSLDQFDLKNLSRLMFGEQWLNRAEMIVHYHSLLRNLMAKSKSEKKQKVEVHPRAKGRDIIFVTPHAKPKFVLAKSDFSVTGFDRHVEGLMNQTYKIKLRDINSAPKLYGKPTSLDLTARFKNWYIGFANLHFFWDYTKSLDKDRYQATIKGIQAKNWPVGIPKVFPIKISNGHANSQSDLQFNGDEMKWTNRVNFSGVQWDLREVPNIGFIVPAMAAVMSRIHHFYLEFEMLRKSGKFNYIVRSNLDNQLQSAIEAVIAKKWDEFKTKLQAAIQDKIQKYRDGLQDEMKTYQAQVMDQIQEREKLVENFRQKAESQVQKLNQSAKKAAQKKVEKKVKSQLEKLKKKLPKVKLPF